MYHNEGKDSFRAILSNRAMIKGVMISEVPLIISLFRMSSAEALPGLSLLVPEDISLSPNGVPSIGHMGSSGD